MGREPGIWWWEKRQCYYTIIEDKRHKLDPDRAEAKRMFHELMAKPEETKAPSDSVVAVMEAFMGWVEKHRSEATYEWYKSFLKPFRMTIRHLRVNQFKPLHVQQWLDGQEDWSDSTKRGAITCVKRCFSWAVKQGYVETSPVAHMEKPEAGKREVILSPAEFKALLAKVKDDRFRDVLEFAWESGARPQEVYALEDRHVQLTNKRIVFPKEESKGKKRPRVIYLNSKALKIVKRLMGKGHLFLNSDGEPFTKDSVNCCFNRLRHSLGKEEMKRKGITIGEKSVKALVATLKPKRKSNGKEFIKTASELKQEAARKLTLREAQKHAPKLCLYNLRHSFCHRLLTAGVDSLTVSVLMGHQNPSMVATTYSHLGRADQHLFDALKKT